MPRITYDQGQMHMLATYFQNTPPSFGPFYVGLGTGPAPLEGDTTLADLSELSGNGYARRSVTRDATGTGWILAGNKVTGPVLSFTNTSPTATWSPIDFVFLTLSPSGVTAPNILIAAIDLEDSVFVGPGESFPTTFKFKTLSGDAA